MIIFLENIRNLRYIRCNTYQFPTRSKPISQKFMDLEKPGRIVAYEVLDKNVKSDFGRFHRKVYFVLKHDWCNDKNGIYSEGMPVEAIHVASLLGEFKESFERLIKLQNCMDKIASVKCQTPVYCKLATKKCVTCMAREVLK